jgi:glutamyl-tRNA(Gln) amidotransferase subunit E
MINSYRLDLFERIVLEVPGVSPVIVATTLEYTWKSLKREGVPLEQVDEAKLLEMFKALSKGLMAKEAIPDVLRAMAEKPDASLSEILEKLGLRVLSLDEVRALVDRIIEENADILKEKEERAFKVVMGKAMSFLRGKVDGKLVSEVVKEKVEHFMRARVGVK